jgi:hypothetical protein
MMAQPPALAGCSCSRSHDFVSMRVPPMYRRSGCLRRTVGRAHGEGYRGGYRHLHRAGELLHR